MKISLPKSWNVPTASFGIVIFLAVCYTLYNVFILQATAPLNPTDLDLPLAVDGLINSVKVKDTRVLRHETVAASDEINPIPVVPLVPGPRLSSSSVKAVIFTRYRSGSSFVGDLFSHHDDVYYIFEPFIITKQLSNMTYADISANSERDLDRIFACDFRRLFSKYRMYPPANRTLFKALWRRVFCTVDGHANPGYVMTNIDPVCTRLNYQTPMVTRDLCKLHRHIVVKTICLRNMSVISHLLRKQIKVIHLIRDPRGQLGSMISLKISKAHGAVNISDFTLEWLQVQAARICRDLDNTLSQARELFTRMPFLRSNYILMRYEDIALSPLRETKDMYEFLGLEMTEKVVAWIKMSTTESVHGVYSTQRNSRQAATSWRRKLPLAFVKVIQENCSDVLRLLGYNNIDTESDLKHIDLVGELTA